jgi:hypothetical protein
MRSGFTGLVAVAAMCLPLAATEGHASFVTFETGQVRPIALSPSQTRLFAINTPDNRLEIFDVNVGDGSLTHAGSVPVGLEPIAVAARTDTEVWVVNHLSDSISIVDVGATPPRVTRTLLVGDEPRDIVFADPPGATDVRAFITTAHRGQNTPFHATIETILTTPSIGRADVWVFDPAALGATLEGTPVSIVTLFGDTPRALAVSPDGSTVYAAVFHSGNQTTPLSEGLVCNGGIGAAPCTPFPGEMTMPGGLPLPNANCSGDPMMPQVGLIVKFNTVSGKWEDELGRDWSNGVRFDLPDEDVFSIDADTLAVGGTPWAGVGTIIFGMIVDPVNPSRVYVTNSDARNEVRFEGPGSCSTTVQGHLHEARVTILDGANVEPRHLNKHIDYDVRPAPAGVKDSSLSIPVGLAVSGSNLYVSAFGSSRVGVFDKTQLLNDTFTPSPSSQIVVSGGGPSGLAVRANRLYVFTRFDNGISVVDTGTNQEISHQALHSPEPANVKGGRRFLYDARTTTSNGESPCGSCHVFGDFDSLSWDLGNPDDETFNNPNPIEFTIPSANKDFRPMKGPMSTQSLRGMANHGPMHWRGDRTGGNDPGGDPLDEDAAFKKFNVAFPGLLGREAELTEVQMDAFTDFILQVTYPPNPIRNLDNSLTASAQNGRDFYFGLLPPDPESDSVRTCNGCHVLNPGLGFFGTDGDTSFENETQLIKVPHLRNMYQKVGMFGMPNITFVNPEIDPMTGLAVNPSPHKGDQVRGVGFLHDGSVDTLFRFHNATVFSQNGINPGGIPVGAAGDPLRRDVEAFMHQFDSNLAPIVGQQTTRTSTNGATVDPRIDLLLARATAIPSECDVVVKGTVGGEQRGYYRLPGGVFQSDRLAQTHPNDAAVRALSTPGQDLTWTCVPPGSGERIGVDRDDDGIYDGDEADAGTDPADPLSFPGPATEVQAKRLTVKDSRPNVDETQRRLILLAKRSGAPALTGNPVADGASLTITLSGVLPTEQTFSLPSSGWDALPVGYRYIDSGGANGPIKSVLLKRTSGGTMTLKVTALGRNGLVNLVPPNTGTSGRAILVTGTNRYCTTMGGAAGGTVIQNDEKLFKAKNATASVVCP